MSGVLLPDMSCFHALRTHFGGQPWALPQQEQHGPGDEPWPSRAAGRAWLNGLLLVHEELASSWQGGEDVVLYLPPPGLEKQERARSFCSALWRVAHLCLKAFPKKKVLWANTEHRSQSHKEESLSWCRGWPAHGAGLVFAFPLGFHDVILPLLAFTRSRVCLWPREERVIFYFNCPTMHPVLSPEWIFGCSVWCALSNAQNNLKENLQSYLVELCHWANSSLQLIAPSVAAAFHPNPKCPLHMKELFFKAKQMPSFLCGWLHK